MAIDKQIKSKPASKAIADYNKQTIKEFDNADAERIRDEFEILSHILNTTANIVDTLAIQQDCEFKSLSWEYKLALQQVVNARQELKSAFSTLTEQMERLNLRENAQYIVYKQVI